MNASIKVKRTFLPEQIRALSKALLSPTQMQTELEEGVVIVRVWLLKLLL